MKFQLRRIQAVRSTRTSIQKERKGAGQKWAESCRELRSRPQPLGLEFVVKDPESTLLVCHVLWWLFILFTVSIGEVLCHIARLSQVRGTSSRAGLGLHLGWSFKERRKGAEQRRHSLPQLVSSPQETPSLYWEWKWASKQRPKQENQEETEAVDRECPGPWGPLTPDLRASPYTYVFLPGTREETELAVESGSTMFKC